MSVEFDTPQPSDPKAGVKVSQVVLDYDSTTVFIRLHYRNAAGEVVKREQIEVGSGPSAEYTTAQFLAILPTATGLNTTLETALITAGRIPSGVVS